MGRSKFPGKPSKHILKKRVSVIPPRSAGDDNNSSSVYDAPSASTTSEQLNNENDCDNGGKSDILNYQSPRPSKIIDSCKAKKRRKSKKNLISSLRANGFKSKLRSTPKTRKRIRKQGDNGTSGSIQRQFTRSAFESKGVVGKFVLPSRSIHSSRVIKPNKRFINVDINETTSLKRKILSKALCTKSSKVMSVKRLNEKNTKFNNKNFNSITDRISKKHVILRQARLKLHSQNMVKPTGPFSSNMNLVSPPGTVTCGVCGAVRFYRFIKQARKFNIYSCESCRKFISKMIKRQSCKSNSSTLVCHKGHGMCHVPPIVRSQQCKLTRSAYRARCPACWLKMCLRSFQMPSTLKNNMIQLLPENMQDPSFFISNNNVLPYEPFMNSDSKRKVADVTLSEPVVKRCPVRFKNENISSPTFSSLLPDSNINRQKMNVKGPRVKHVCRSASIVLGQPIAMFSNDKNKINESQDSTALETRRKNTQEATKSKNIVSVTDSGSDKANKPVLEPKPIVPCIQEDRKQKNSTATANHVPVSMPVSKIQPKQTRSKLKNKISIDYWKNYDQSKTTEMGYSLIATEQFSITSVCYLCGSAGKENLLYCSLCCEPYHLFCLDQSCFLRGVMSKEESWLCPKCTVCTVCNLSSEKKVECQKCCKTYHPHCLSNTQSISSTSPVVCSECSLCKSCGSSTVTPFIINTPLCESCFKLKCPNKKCPSCQECYDKHNTKNQIIECESCKCWIHVKCSNISEEVQVVLSVLPEPIGYTCDSCAEHTKSYWQAAVIFKLNLYLYKILQQLSENRNARNLLKWNFNGSHKTQGVTRRSNEKTISGEDNSDSGSNDDCKEEYAKFDSYTLNDLYDELPFGNIRTKIYTKSYTSVQEFNSEMEELLNRAGSEQLLKLYQNILNKIFPQFSTGSSALNTSLHIKHIEDLITTPKDTPLVNLIKYDTRYCTLCRQTGEGSTEREARMLYCGNNEWVHANCALWSQEVYENINGFLRNIHTALSRGRTTSCAVCKEEGATVNCSHKDCLKIYHFHCAHKANCIFAFNKLVFCSTHYTSHTHLTVCKNFSVSRPLYIEKNDTESYTEIEKVNVMIGSLRISSLGRINCLLSDSNDAIIPIGFKCTRLYWSTVEPWKVTSYSITTSAGTCHINSTANVGTNFTINHALPSHMVNQKIKEMTQWFKEVDRKNNILDSEDEEENQNSADLLSPELTDAIFEEIPHDLLDRISVQDIFPKLINYDDLLNNDLKFDDSVAKQTKTDKEARSELLLRNKDKTAEARNQSCSVTVSCKLNRSASPALKKKKVIAKQSNLFVQLVQLDGHIDDSDSEGSLFDSIRKVVKKVNRRHNKLRHIPQLDGNSDDTVSRELEYFLDTSKRQKLSNSEEPVTCSRCHCTYRTTLSYNKHLDSCEVVTSESDSEMVEQDSQIPAMNITVMPANGKTQESFTSVPFMEYSQPQPQKNVSIFIPDKGLISIKATEQQKCLDVQGANINLNHNYVNTSTPSVTPVFITQQPNSMDASHNSLYSVGQPLITLSTGENKQCPSNQMPIFSNQAIPTNVPINVLVNSSGQVEGAVNVINTPCINYPNTPITLNTNSDSTAIQNYQPVSISTHPVSVSNQPLQYINNGNSYMAIDPNHVALNGKIVGNPNILNNSLILASDAVQKNTMMPSSEESLSVKNGVNKQNETFIIPGNSPAVIVQNVPSTNYVSYVAQPYAPEECKPTVAPQMTAPLQPATQIQPDNTISIIPAIQPTVVIQQPQYILDNNIPITITQQPVAQPMYYGFETIIQNTVMASQQILPSAVPGVITANSSYSTTTQVFQTSSKLEPIIDIPQSALVVVSSGQIIGTVPLQLSYSQPTTPQYQVNSVAEMNSQALKITDSSHTTPSSSSKSVMNNIKAITLPTAPLVMKKEQGIPTNVVAPNPKATNVVPPIPKPPNRNFRPMNRVLPMKKNVVSLKKPLDEVDKPITKEREPFSAVVDDKSKTIFISKSDCQEFAPQVKELIHSMHPENVQSVKSTKQKDNTHLRQYSHKLAQQKSEKAAMQVPIAPVKQERLSSDLHCQVKREIKQEEYKPERFISNDARNNLASLITRPATVSSSSVPSFNISISAQPHTAKSATVTTAVTSTKTIPTAPSSLTYSATSSPFQPQQTANYLNFQGPIQFPHSIGSTGAVARQTYTYSHSRNLNASTRPITSAPRMRPNQPSTDGALPAYVYGKANGPTYTASSSRFPSRNQSFAKPVFLPCTSTSVSARNSLSATAAGKMSHPISSKPSLALQSMPSLAPCPPIGPPTGGGNISLSSPSGPSTASLSSPKVTSKCISSQNQTPILKSPMYVDSSSKPVSRTVLPKSSPVISPKASCTLVSSTHISATTSNKSSSVSTKAFSVFTPKAASAITIPNAGKSTSTCHETTQNSNFVTSYSNTSRGGIPPVSVSTVCSTNSHGPTIISASTASCVSTCSPSAKLVTTPSTAALTIDAASGINTSLPLSIPSKPILPSYPAYTSAAISSCSATTTASTTTSIRVGQTTIADAAVVPGYKTDMKESSSTLSARTLGSMCKNDDIEGLEPSKMMKRSKSNSIDTGTSSAVTSQCNVDNVHKKADTVPVSNKNCNNQTNLLYATPSQTDTKEGCATTNLAVNQTSNCLPVSGYTPPTVTAKSNQCPSIAVSSANVANTSTANTANVRKKSTEKTPAILYTIETQDGHQYSSTNLGDLWKKVVETVENARAAHNIPTMSKKSVSNINGIQLLGLNSDSLKYLIEQLPGAGKCSKYRSNAGFCPLQTESEDELPFGHLCGSIRCAPYVKNNRDNHDMFGWLTSKHRKPEYNTSELDLLPRRNSVSNLPMTMRFRQLKLTSKLSVGVYRSKIHRRGLFCLRDIEAGEMVIEYAGEVIRSVLCDKREKYYNSKGIGCYMFRVDDNLVVDATMKGNAARFINHSCDPNCYSKVVEIFGHKHIIIFALRKILCGEELTYDYKFPFEEDKIPCTCGSRRCRKFLN